MKFFFKYFLLTLIVSSTIFSQSIFVKKFDENKNNKLYKIDAHKFLAEQEKEVTKFLNENPNYFEEQKLQKLASWDFSVGTAKSWWALNTLDDSFYKVPSTCQAVGTHCYIFVEDALWNSRVVLENVNSIKEAFDSKTPADSNKGIFETVVDAFGTPPNVDGDDKIIILILDIIDGYDSSGGYVAGYFHPINEISHPISNNAEIYYLDADPADLSTENGLTQVLSTTAHEFQHMIHFNYHNGSVGKPIQLTFINEGCSLTSEVVCGYTIRNQTLFNNEYNHYLFDWREGDEVLTDYARAARYITYFYDQFGKDFLGKLVQSSKLSIASINDALSKLSNPTDLRFSETLENWFMANTINDNAIKSEWGYTTPFIYKVNAKNILNPNYTSPIIELEKAASNYVTYSSGTNLSIQFDDFGNGKIKFKAIKYDNNNNIEVEDIIANTLLTYSDFGTKYKAITFVAMNVSPSNKYDYSYISTGESSAFTLAYDENPPTGVLPLTANDTVCVMFDGVSGASLDSITVALRQTGSVYGGIYEYSGDIRPSPLGKVLLSNLTVTSNIAERPVYDNGYPEPWPNWVTIDLTSHNIDVSNPFVVAFVVEGSYPENNRIMITEQPNVNNHSFTYLQKPSSDLPNWYSVTSSETDIYAYLIRAYVNTIVSVNETQSEIVLSEFSLEHNYPNPFNPSTTINYSIAEDGFVTLKIYNMLGQEVAKLVNENKSVGNYSVTFDASSISQDIASGTYIYELRSSGNRIANKMLLIK